MNPYIYVALAGLSPVWELRAAIPIGIGLRLDLLTLTLVAIAANIAVIPLTFILLKISNFRKLVFRIAGKRTAHKIARHGRRFEFWGELALIPFVAIPIPLSGAYTAIFLAEALGLNRLRSGLAIAIGICMAAAIVVLASVGMFSLW